MVLDKIGIGTMRQKSRTIEGEAEQLKLLAQTQDGFMLSQFVAPTERVMLAALAFNGKALRYIVRPNVQLQKAAIKQTIEAIPYCPATRRGNNQALQAEVQVTAFDTDPVCLLMYPERFDSHLENATRPGLLNFANAIISAWLEYDANSTILQIDQDNIRHALRLFVEKNKELVPVWHVLKASFFTEQDVVVYNRLESLTQEHGERVCLGMLYLETRKYPSVEAWRLICAQTDNWAERIHYLTLAFRDKTEAVELPKLD